MDCQSEEWDDVYEPQADIRSRAGHHMGNGSVSDGHVRFPAQPESPFPESDHFYGHVPPQPRPVQVAQSQMQPLQNAHSRARGTKRTIRNELKDPNPTGHVTTMGQPSPGQTGTINRPSDPNSFSSHTRLQSATLPPPAKKSPKKRFASKEEEAEYWKRREANNIAAQKSRACKKERLDEAETKIKNLESRLDATQDEILAQAKTIDALTKSNAVLTSTNQTLTTVNAGLLQKSNHLEKQLASIKRVLEQGRYELAISRKTSEQKDYEIHTLKATITELESKTTRVANVADQYGGRVQGPGNQDHDQTSQWPWFDDSMTSAFADSVPQMEQNFKTNQASGLVQKSSGDSCGDFEDPGITAEDLEMLSEFLQSTGDAMGAQESGGNPVTWSIDYEVSHTMAPEVSTAGVNVQ